MDNEKTLIKAVKYIYDFNELNVNEIAKLLGLDYDTVFHMLVCEEVEYNG